MRNKSISLLVRTAGFIALVSASTGNPAYARRPIQYSIHGKLVACPDYPALRDSIAKRDFAYFTGWSEFDYQATEGWIKDCAGDGAAKDLKEFKASRNEMQMMQTQAELRDHARVVQLQRSCTQSPGYQLFRSQEAIIYDEDALKRAYAILEHEKRVAAVSGTTDLSASHQAGEQIVDLQDKLAVEWHQYTGAGGTARSPDLVTHSARDPCS